MDRPAAYAVYSGPLGDIPYEELIAVRENVQALRDSEAWAFLVELVEAVKQRNVDRIVHGKLLEQAEYAAATSLVSGLDQAIHAADATLYAADAAEREQAQLTAALEA